MTRIKSIARGLLAISMTAIGTLHFISPEPFIQIVPSFLPQPRWLVYISGACEIAGGIGLLVPRVRKPAAWGLIALYLAVFPANINMAVTNMPVGGQQYPLLLWLRLPFQALFIAWAWWCGDLSVPHRLLRLRRRS